MKQLRKDVQWVVQSNLTSREDLEGLRQGCKDSNLNCIEVKIIPFSTALPEFEITPHNIYYGSTTFNNLIYTNTQTRSGIFFNPETFAIENYIDKWGQHMLNFGASITTFKDLMSKNYDSEKPLFIRPNDDSKSFPGEVKKFSQITEWYELLRTVSNTNLSLESKIVVAEPYNIKSEWRLWIVNGKVITASKYREYFTVSKERGCPAEVESFAEMRCKEYTPHDVFVMDVCFCGDDNYIIECGCMNGAGFYKANVSKIVKHVSEYFSKVCRA